MNKRPKLVVPEIHRAHRPFIFPLIGKTLQYLSGWEVEGTVPNINKVVVVCAPHTSNWDFIFGMILMLSVDIKVNFLAKKSIFVPGFNIILNKLGGIPVDRNNPELLVEQMARFTKNNKGVILAVTPEGTRKKVTRWKTGFLRIAQSAQCKVLPLGIDYPSKTFNFGELFDPTGNNEKDVIALQMSLKDYKGRHPERH